MNELSIVNNSGTLTARDIREQVNLIQEVMKEVMQGPSKKNPQGVHYGVIPGCKKPTLYKAGAEKLAATFRIAIKSEVEDLSTSDNRHFRVICTGYSPSGLVLGSAVGECSSDEEKFRWRSPVCNEEFDEADIDQKREKWVKGYQGEKAYKKKQLRTEPSDLANTILQLADKRAYVAVVRKITAASDVFTQDIEDLPPEIQNDIAENNQQRPTNGKPEVEPVIENDPVDESKAPSSALECSACGAVVSQKVFDYSNSKMGKPLCFNCQKTEASNG